MDVARSYTTAMNAIDLECPQCGARPGERCRTDTGKWQPVAHAKRKLAAFRKTCAARRFAKKTPKPSLYRLKSPSSEFEHRVQRAKGLTNAP
jgi:hypothetical protein